MAEVRTRAGFGRNGGERTRSVLEGFPRRAWEPGDKIPTTWLSENWSSITPLLSKTLSGNSQKKTISTKQGHKIEYDEQDASKAKIIIDQIDAVLGKYYGLTEEELDFIINYDIKDRMGKSLWDREEAEASHDA